MDDSPFVESDERTVACLAPHRRPLPTMSPLSPPGLALVPVVVAFCQFVFVSGRTNPLRRPLAPSSRRRWRYGRRLGLAAFAGTLAAMSALLFGAPLALGIAAGAVAYVPIAAVAVVLFHRRDGLREPHRRRGRDARDEDSVSSTAAPGTVPVTASAKPGAVPPVERDPDRTGPALRHGRPDILV